MNSANFVYIIVIFIAGEQPLAQGTNNKQSSSSFNNKAETETDLISRYTDEVQLDKQYQTAIVGDIELRLAKLRGDGQPSEQSQAGSTSVSNRKLR